MMVNPSSLHSSSGPALKRPKATAVALSGLRRVCKVRYNKTLNPKPGLGFGVQGSGGVSKTSRDSRVKAFRPKDMKLQAT